MQLLVSVRSAEEVPAALAGGADIIDAKEPDRGSLGPVDPGVLREILRRVPGRHAISVALGDVSRPDDVCSALDRLELRARRSPTYLKLGFAGVDSANQIVSLIQIAVASSNSMAASPHIIAVAYADSDRAGTIEPELIPGLAVGAGAAGVLLDTHGKDGLSLLHWFPEDRLRQWVGSSRESGLITALAGGLQAGDLATVCQAEPAVIGVRGAACSGGRQGRVSASRVRQLRRALERAVCRVAEPTAATPVAKRRTPGRFLPT